MLSKRHRHWFTSLWWHLGEYGPQNVHIHSCIEGTDCDRVVVGPGRNCDGDQVTHQRETLGVKDPWKWALAAAEPGRE